MASEIKRAEVNIGQNSKPLGAEIVTPMGPMVDGLDPVQSITAVREAARVLRMPSADIAAAIGTIVKEIKPVPPLRS